MDMPFASVRELSRALATRAVSCREAVQTCLDRIAAVNGVINAMLHVDAPGALAQAEGLDAEAARGTLRGPLHGVPFTLKDSFATEGLPTTCGVKEWAGHRPPRDAAVVQRLRRAGAVLLGKTSLPPYLSTFETVNEIVGRTSNPYGSDRSAGGSSGGEAAIVASGGSTFGVGSDRGGSIRVPCHYCGVAGLKPTAGTITALGHVLMPIGPLKAEPGPIARYVEDLSLIMEVLSPGSTRVPCAPGPYTIAWYSSCEGTEPDAAIAASLRDAVAALSDDGHDLEEAHPPGLGIAREVIQSLSNVHNEVFGSRVIPEFFEPPCRTAEDLAPLAQVWLARARRWSHESPMSGFEYFCHEMRLDILRSRVETFLESYDAILCPVSGSTALPHGFTRDPRQGAIRANTFLYSLSGNPAVSVPVGRDAAGLPVGLQVVGRAREDGKVLRLASVLETRLGGWVRPPI